MNTRHFIKKTAVKCKTVNSIWLRRRHKCRSKFWKKIVATWIYFQVCSMFTRVDVCSSQPLCRGIQSAFRRDTHQRLRRRRVYFGPFRNNSENNGVDQIVTRPDNRRSIHDVMSHLTWSNFALADTLPLCWYIRPPKSPSQRSATR